MNMSQFKIKHQVFFCAVFGSLLVLCVMKWGDTVGCSDVWMCISLPRSLVIPSKPSF